MVTDWLDMVEVNLLDWNRHKSLAERDMRRMINEVRRMRAVIQVCAGTEDLARVKQIIRAERGAHGY